MSTLLTSNDPTRYVQLVKIHKVNGELKDELAFTYRIFATDDEAWFDGHSVWHEWLRQNPGVRSHMSINRQFPAHDGLRD